MGLHVRLSLFIMVFALLFTAVASYGFYRYSYEKEYQASLHALEQLLETVYKTAEIAAYSGNSVIGSDVADGLLNNDLVKRVMLNAEEVALEVGDVYGPDAVPLVRELYSPFDEGIRVGQLAIVPDGAEIDRRAAAKSRANTVLIMVVLLALAVMLVLSLGRLLSRPVKSLATRLQRLNPGERVNLTIPSHLKGSELDVLVQSINDLFERADQQLKRERRLRDRIDSMAENFRMVFDLAGNPVAITDTSLSLLNFNPAFRALLDMAEGHQDLPLDQQWVDRLLRNPEELRQQLHHLLHADSQTHIQLDVKLNDQRVGRRWASLHVKDAVNDQGQRVLLFFFYDVTRHQEALAAIRQEAERDGLTQLYNRRAGGEKIQAHLQQGASLALLVVDLDGFKSVNDTQGHDAGDAVLKAIASRLQDCTRKSDIVARWGGDEFVLALLESDRSAAAQIAESILQRITEPVDTGKGRQATVSASIGVTICPDDAATFEQAFEQADMTMYEVKKQGKGQVRFSIDDGR